jgi:starch synthase
MRILYVSSEGAPFIASGGLGDVIGALPKTMKELCEAENDVAVILPLYGQISRAMREKMTYLTSFEMEYSWRKAYCGIFEATVDGVKYYFVDNEQYFKREGALYGHGDDGERFAFFSMAVIEFMLRTGNIPDILHANDWQTAMTVIYLRTKYADNDALRGVKSVYTIHNIEYQGKFDPYILGNVFALDESFKSILEYDGCLNLMKGAIVCADRVTTVSPNYANELRHAFFAFGLQDIVNMYAYKISGIINGIDTVYFSPDEGGDIVVPYSLATVGEGKAENKMALQREIGLPVNAEIPMIVMITRLTPTKGIDLVLHIFDELMQENVQFVILGTGDSGYEHIFRNLEARHPDKCRALIKFDRVLSKKMYASADIFLMPSKSEPCGLAQMIACSYGTIPVVRAVGGLYDTIKPFGTDASNGFLFNNFNAHEMLFKIKDAIRLYYGARLEWNELVERAMKTDFTWKNSAEKYLQLYQNLI